MISFTTQVKIVLMAGMLGVVGFVGVGGSLSKYLIVRPPNIVC